MADIQQIPFGKTLSHPGHPKLLLKERVALDCGCCFWIGKRLDNGELATGAESCTDAHKSLMDEAHQQFSATLPSTSERPLADVLSELLDQAEESYQRSHHAKRT